MKENRFPTGWNEEKVRRVVDYYERQTEEEAVAEDKAAYERQGLSMMEIPYELVPKVRELVTQHESSK